MTKSGFRRLLFRVFSLYSNLQDEITNRRLVLDRSKCLRKILQVLMQDVLLLNQSDPNRQRDFVDC